MGYERVSRLAKGGPRAIPPAVAAVDRLVSLPLFREGQIVLTFAPLGRAIGAGIRFRGGLDDPGVGHGLFGILRYTLYVQGWRDTESTICCGADRNCNADNQRTRS
jgi:hypothetical protein